MSTWNMIKSYINSQEIGAVINRKDLIYHVYGGPMPKKYLGSYGSTLDNYRRLLTKLGLLKHVSLGRYEVKYHIREDLKTNQLRLLVDNGITM